MSRPFSNGEDEPFGESEFRRFGILMFCLPSIEMLGYFDKEVGAGETCPKILRADFIRPYGLGR